MEKALAGVAQWTEHPPATRKVVSRGTCLAYRPGPQEGVCQRWPTDVSLAQQSFSLPSPLPKNK